MALRLSYLSHLSTSLLTPTSHESSVWTFVLRMADFEEVQFIYIWEVFLVNRDMKRDWCVFGGGQSNRTTCDGRYAILVYTVVINLGHSSQNNKRLF